MGVEAAMAAFGVGTVTVWRYSTLYQLFMLTPALLGYPASGINFWYVPILPHARTHT